MLLTGLSKEDDSEPLSPAIASCVESQRNAVIESEVGVVSDHRPVYI